MKRQIVCNKCKDSLRKLFPTDMPYPGEHVKLVKGKAKKDFMCDRCGCDINATDNCWAVSIWADYGGIPYYEWEDEYLFDIAEEKE